MTWAERSIGEITIVVTKGTTPSTYGMPFTEEGINFIKAEALNGDVTLDHNGFTFIDDETHEKLKRSQLHENDVLITIAGANVGKCGYVRQSDVPANTNQAVGIIRVKPEEANPRYIYYHFKKPSTFAMCQGIGGGQAAQPNINLTMLKNIKVSLPNVQFQDRVVEVIGAYDDLIENNKRRIELLEESARQLYKEWFVRFRFPGHEHVKIIDGVPEGWSFKRLKEIANITMGQSPKSEFYNSDGEGLPFHQGVTKFGFRFVEHETYCTKPTRLSKPGDILFSVRAPVGRLNITNDTIVLGRGLSAIHSIDGYQSFLFYALKSYFFKEDMIGGGAIYASVTKKDLENQELLIPSIALLQEFDDFASGVDKQIFSLHQINVNLTKARDILLPKLMSGEIGV